MECIGPRKAFGPDSEVVDQFTQRLGHLRAAERGPFTQDAGVVVLNLGEGSVECAARLHGVEWADPRQEPGGARRTDGGEFVEEFDETQERADVSLVLVVGQDRTLDLHRERWLGLFADLVFHCDAGRRESLDHGDGCHVARRAQDDKPLPAVGGVEAVLAHRPCGQPAGHEVARQRRHVGGVAAGEEFGRCGLLTGEVAAFQAGGERRLGGDEVAGLAGFDLRAEGPFERIEPALLHRLRGAARQRGVNVQLCGTLAHGGEQVQRRPIHRVPAKHAHRQRRRFGRRSPQRAVYLRRPRTRRAQGWQPVVQRLRQEVGEQLRAVLQPACRRVVVERRKTGPGMTCHGGERRVGVLVRQSIQTQEQFERVPAEHRRDHILSQAKLSP